MHEEFSAGQAISQLLAESFRGDFCRVSTPDLVNAQSVQEPAILPFAFSPRAVPLPPPLWFCSCSPDLGSSRVCCNQVNVGPCSEEPSRYLITVTNDGF
jgi:hypothetical protein